MDDFRALMRQRFERRHAPMDLWEFVHTLTLPDVTDEFGEPVDYDPTSHPGQYHALRLLAGEHGTYQEFLLIGDSQGFGKSWLLQQYTFHLLVERAESMIYGLPNHGLWADVWQQKIRPAITGAGLEEFLPRTGPGSREGGAPRSVRLRRIDGRGGGQLLPRSTHGRQEAAQSAVTVRGLLLDEYDEWLRPAVSRIRRRLDRWMGAGLGVILKASTIKNDRESLALEDDAESSQGRVEYRCPYCKKYTRLSWDTWNPQQVEIACLRCSHPVDEQSRRRMLADVGHTRLVMDRPAASKASILCTALECPWKSLAWLAALDMSSSAKAAGGMHEERRQFVRDQQCQQYQDDQEHQNINHHYLATKSAKQTEYALPVSDNPHDVIVPAMVERAVMVCDVQKDRIYWMVLGAKADSLFWLLAWGQSYYARKDEVDLAISDERRAILLDEMYHQAFAEGWQQVDADGTPIMATGMGVDIGWRSKEVGKWIRRHANTYAIRGADPSTKHGKIEMSGSAVVKTYFGGLVQRRKQTLAEIGQPRYWLFVKTASVREVTHERLMLEQDERGSIQVPRGISAEDAICRHLSAWRMETDDAGVTRWVKHGRRDDYDDLVNYGVCLLVYLHERMGTPEKNENANKKTETRQAHVPTRSSGWVGGGEGWV